jgi:hypothetical protein
MDGYLSKPIDLKKLDEMLALYTDSLVKNS